MKKNHKHEDNTPVPAVGKQGGFANSSSLWRSSHLSAQAVERVEPTEEHGPSPGVATTIADSLNNCSTWRCTECSMTLIISHFFPQMEWSASCAYGSSLKDVGALSWSLQDVLSLTHVHLFVSEFKMWYIWVRKTRFLSRLLLFQLRTERCWNMLFE